jgi:hypothetical protein
MLLVLEMLLLDSANGLLKRLKITCLTISQTVSRKEVQQTKHINAMNNLCESTHD